MLARRLARVFCGLAIALGSCSAPEFDFKGTAEDDGGTPPVEHCSNNTLDGDQGETDRDCGGTCPPCGNGFGCALPDDCLSGQCIDLVCQDEHCLDGVVSGDESGSDCGGSCAKCPDGGTCNQASDCESGVCGTDNTCAAPSCTDKVKNGFESDIDCGGTECDKCTTGKTCVGRNDCISTECTNGMCTVVCLEGTGNCDGDMDNGCETNLKIDADNCDACGAACNLPHAEAACSAGMCVIDACTPPFLDCDSDETNGCETNGSNDSENCGACGMGCIGINGSAFCASSACQITCDTGFDDCNDDRADGCEKNIQADVNNCGMCGKACSAVDGTPWCDMGVCGISDCPDGKGDCNADPDDGCEVNLTNDVGNCNTCGNICVTANGTPACEASKCVVDSCNAGRDNCDANAADGGYADGCETNINNDAENCGSCGNECNIANATATCNAGMCRVGSCTPPFADCNNDGTSCETNTSTNATNCGGCGMNGNNCTTAFSHASGTCQNSVCTIGACTGTWLNCNVQSSDGCEVDPAENDNHCGGCNQPCLDTNANNHCDLGVCVAECNTNFLSCDSNPNNGCEVNKLESDSNCNGCGIVCQEVNTTDPPGTDDGNSCNNGVCVPTCNSSSLNCSNPNDGCEINKLEDDNNCNGCGIVCQDINANNHCDLGACVPACSTNFLSCDGDPNDGCEVNKTTDEANCGTCGTICATAHASAGSTCTATAGGTCVPSCDGGWKACSNPQNGCTTQLGTTSNCLDCGDACGGSAPLCLGSGCALDIVVVNYDTNNNGGWQGATTPTSLTITHTLQTATNNNRLVLVGVAGQENFLDPETVTYNGIAMLPVPGASGTSDTNTYAGLFYMLDGPLPDATGMYPVVVTYSSGAAWGTGLANVVELRNVDQTTPVSNGTAVPNAADCTGVARTLPITVSQPGSFLYGFAAARNASSIAVTLGAPQAETFNATTTNPAILRAAGGRAVASSNTTFSWDMAGCWSSVLVGATVRRVGVP